MPTVDLPARPDAILVSIKDAARLLGLSRTTVYDLLDRGDLTSRYHGRRRLVELASLRAYAATLPTERAATG